MCWGHRLLSREGVSSVARLGQIFLPASVARLVWEIWPNLATLGVSWPNLATLGLSWPNLATLGVTLFNHSLATDHQTKPGRGTSNLTTR